MPYAHARLRRSGQDRDETCDLDGTCRAACWMTLFAGHISLVIVLTVGFLLAVIVTQQRRSPQSTLAWLLAFVLLPYGAIPLFLLLGFRDNRADGLKIDFGGSASPNDVRSSPLEDVFAVSGLPPALAGHDFSLLDTPQAAHHAIFDIIARTQHDLWVSFYIVSKDPEGRAFLTALTEKARTGVDICLLLDWLGGIVAPRGALRDFKQAGGKLRYSATPHVRWNGRSLNLRNHRKMIISDGTAVFAGGMNIGGQYMTPSSDSDAWSDLSFTLSGPAINTFVAVFQADWFNANDKALPKRTTIPAKTGAARLQLVPSGPGIEGDVLHDALVHAIHCARAQIWLATPYYLPSDALNEALMSACKRGLDVVVMTPARSNQRLTDLARGPYLRALQTRGGKVLLHPGMLHAKMGVIDDAAWVGSANFDMRSMFLNSELSLFVSDADSRRLLTAWFANQAKHCKIMTRVPTRLQQFVEGFFRLLAPIL